MFRRLSWVLSLCLLLALAAGTAFCQNGATKMEYRFVPGEVLSYQMVMDMNIDVQFSMPDAAQITPQSIRVAGIRNQQVRKVYPSGDAEILYTFNSMKISAGGIWQDVPQDQFPPVLVLMNKYGVIKAVKGLDKVGGQFSQVPFLNLENVSLYSAIVPSIALKQGEAWTQDMPLLGSGTGSPMKVQGTLVYANTKVQNVNTAGYKLKVGGNVSIAMPLPASGSGPQTSPRKIASTGTVQAVGANYFSTELGKMVRTDGIGNVRLSMEVPATGDLKGGTATMNMKTTYKIYLVNN